MNQIADDVCFFISREHVYLKRAYLPQYYSTCRGGRSVRDGMIGAFLRSETSGLYISRSENFMQDLLVSLAPSWNRFCGEQSDTA